MAGARKLAKDEYLFKEGDPSDAMYVLKSGRLAVTKAKANAEIVLAEISPGAMVGEMAFFDNKPRSASVKAMQTSEVIALPFSGLHKQFASFPEWTKAIMRTVNEHLRAANKRIKSLEQVEGEVEVFTPQVINQLMTILNLVTAQYGQANQDGMMTIHSNRIRTFTIQIFQLPTHKMDKLIATLADLKLLTSKDTGDGYSIISLLKPEVMLAFVEWHNKWLFTKAEERIILEETELPALKGYIHFANKVQVDAKGLARISITFVQNESEKELGYSVKKEEAHRFIKKGWMTEIIMEDDQLWTTFDRKEISQMVPFWEIIYKLREYK